MPLTFERTEEINKGRGLLRVYYRDEFGQPRFFEFTDLNLDYDVLGQELIRQVNELLVRPRPSLVGLVQGMRDKGMISG